LESHTAAGRAKNPDDPNPDWFNDCLKHPREIIEFPLAESAGERKGVLRFEIARRLLCCQLGNLVLVRLPLRVARLVDYACPLPDEESAYDQLFVHLLSRELDGIHLESVRPETFLWKYLQSSPLIQKSFCFYSQRGPSPHWLIRLDGSFSDYLKRLSPKARKNRLREIKILRERGDVKLIRVTEASDVDAFLKEAYDISQKTRQFRRFGWSLAARDPCLVKNELLRLARHGWLRSYLLTCDGMPCSFILGEQSGLKLHPVAAGADPDWRVYSVGTVLLLLALEDLFKEHPPEFYDLGAGVHKELATHSYLDDDIWLFRRRPYTALVSSFYRMCNLTSKIGGAALERLGVKAKVTRLMHRIDSA
jgi:hypothetical protein